MPSDGDRLETAGKKKKKEERNERDRKRRAEDPEFREQTLERQRKWYADHTSEQRRKELRERIAARREDPGVRERERTRKRELRAEAKTLLPEAAKRVYEEYRRWLRWPEVPPTGLLVALSPKSLGWTSRKPVMVRLNVPQPESNLSGASVPSFIADPLLDLTKDQVKYKALREGASEEAYEAARQVQDDLQSLLSLEGFGGHAVLALSYAGRNAGVRPAQGAQPGSPVTDAAALDVDVDVDVDADAVMRSGLDGSFYGDGADADAAFAAPGSWSEPVNAVAPYAGGHDGYVYPEEGWQALPPGMFALSQGVQQMTIAASASAQDVGYQVAYSSRDNHYGDGTSRGAAYPWWNTTADQSPVPQATAYLPPAQSAGWSAGAAWGAGPAAGQAPVNSTRHTRTR
ncbi:hypothetical protein [Streptomyces sp. NPDC006012]|uniref:hypothetical protein n=1 Tax=Streptomyces sp. NPDC006012 TaxID=3364739 RepID=UPI0036C1C0CB